MDLVLQTLVTGLALGVTYALIAIGLTIVFGLGKVVNFAHGEFVMLAGYGVVLALSWGLGYFPGILVGVALAAAVGLLLERSVISRGMYSAPEHVTIIVTFAVAVGLSSLVQWIASSNPISAPSPLSDISLSLGGIQVDGQRAFTALIGVLAIVGLNAFLYRTHTGIQLRAVSENPRGALYSGIHVGRIRAIGFTIGAGLAGLAGALLAPSLTVYPTMGHTPVIIAFTVVVLGGLGSVGGATLGGLLFGVTYAFVGTYFAVEWTTAVGWLLVIIMLLVRPRGLMGAEPTRA